MQKIYNSEKNVLNKIERRSKIGQEKISLIYILEIFWTAIAKVYFLYFQLKMRLFQYFLIS